MTIQTTYTQARDGLAKLLDQVTTTEKSLSYNAAERKMWR